MNGDLIGEVLVIFLFCVLVILIVLYIRQTTARFGHNIAGKLEVPGDKHGYAYDIGNIFIFTTDAFGIQIKLPDQLPHIIVDAHANDHYGRGLTFAADSSQRLELEGDFYKKFAVYAPQGYERDAVQLLSPDIMDLLSQRASTFDLEIYGRSLNLLTAKNPIKNVLLQQELIEVSQILILKLQTFFSEWSREDHGDTQKMFLSGKGMNMYKLGRHEINPAFIKLAPVILLLIYFILHSR